MVAQTKKGLQKIMNALSKTEKENGDKCDESLQESSKLEGGTRRTRV